MSDYRAFDLRLSSEIPFPELLPERENGEAAVQVRFGKVRDERWTPRTEDGHDAHFEARAAYFYWEPVGTFAVLEGREIWIDPAPDAAPDLLRVPLLGTVIAALLEQRGDFVLHAGAVAIAQEDTEQSRAAVFVGWKGAGKSTMTASLWKRGHRLLCDDVVAIRMGADGKPWVYPGFPQFKLWPESAEGVLGENPQSLPELHSATEKRTRLAFEGFSLTPTPLHCVFALEPILPDQTDDPDVEILPLTPSEAVSQLITHSYAARWGNALLQGAAGASHFMRCVQLANVISVSRLRRRMEMSLLPEVVRRVENAVNDAPSDAKKSSEAGRPSAIVNSNVGSNAGSPSV